MEDIEDVVVLERIRADRCQIEHAEYNLEYLLVIVYLSCGVCFVLFKRVALWLNYSANGMDARTRRNRRFLVFFPPTPTPGCGQTSDFVSLLNFFL